MTVFTELIESSNDQNIFNDNWRNNFIIPNSDEKKKRKKYSLIQFANIVGADCGKLSLVSESITRPGYSSESTFNRMADRKLSQFIITLL